MIVFSNFETNKLFLSPFIAQHSPVCSLFQSDICHQSVYELVHSEDREELQRQLMWNSALAADRSGLKLEQVLQYGELTDTPTFAHSLHFDNIR